MIIIIEKERGDTHKILEIILMKMILTAGKTVPDTKGAVMRAVEKIPVAMDHQIMKGVDYVTGEKKQGLITSAALAGIGMKIEANTGMKIIPDGDITNKEEVQIMAVEEGKDIFQTGQEVIKTMMRPMVDTTHRDQVAAHHMGAAEIGNMGKDIMKE